MPLLDHFHPPLLGHRRWDGFYRSWLVTMADRLNETLPPDYFAEVRSAAGTRVEVDAEIFPQGGAAPPTPVAVMPGLFPDDFEVQVFSSVAGPILVAAIELVSPGNKDRDDARRAFAAKCAAYLQRGIGVMIVDVVTSRHANLHDELIALLGHAAAFKFPTPTFLYATAYRPVHRDERNEIDLWREPLTLGGLLPTLPLAVRGLGSLPIDLEATYMEARKRSRIG